MSFKNGLRVHTTSNVINDALMTDFSSQNDPKIGPKSLPNWFQRASERGLNEDSDSKLKKQTARSIDGATAPLKLEGFGVSGGGKQGGGKTPISPHAGQPLDKPRGRRINILFVAWMS